MFIAQYIARLGVPIFFVISGYFLGQKINDSSLDTDAIAKRYLSRITKLFSIWFILYLPAIIARGIINNEGKTWTLKVLLIVQEILFKCPAYLWYLVALIVAIYPAVYLYQRNKYVSLILAAALYILGCLGNTYLYVPVFSEIWDPYLNIFLTTRNGVFFAFPYLTLGIFLYGMSGGCKSGKMLVLGSIASWMIFAAEVSLASGWFQKGGDCSMYFSMPLVVVILFWIFKDLKIKLDRSLASFLRRISTWIYCSQYFFITATLFVASRFLGVTNELLLWAMVVVFDIIAFMLIHKFLPKLEQILT